MKNFKKLFAIAASVLMLASTVPTAVLGATNYSDELQGAYDYAYGIGVTTQSSIDNANMFGTLLRSHMAKMMVNYAKEVKGLTANTSLECNFTDISNQSDELRGYIKEACQMGLMGQGITAFNPNGVVTRAQFGTVLSRILYGAANDGGDPYYADHLAALKDAGIMTNISNPNAPEVRGYVMLMMQRAADGGTNPAVCDELANQVACGLGLDTCPAQCQTVVNTNGNLDVSLKSSVGGDIPYGISSLPVATYKFTADEDVSLNSLTFKQLGFGNANTIDKIALFINGARVSKSVNIDDEATLNLTNSYEIKAGETVNVEVHAAITAAASGSQFSLKLLNVESSAKDVSYATNLTSATYTVLTFANANIGAAFLTDVETPKMGAIAADIFDYRLQNQANDQDVSFKSITFKGADTDYSTYLENFKLVIDDVVVATAKTMNGKYLSFNIPEGYLVKDDNNVTMTVRADVIGGAGESNLPMVFSVENAMDIVVIGDKYDVPMGITFGDNSSSTDISAGKVTITRTNPSTTTFVGNTDNVLLGAFTITNNAGGSLTMKDFRLAFSANLSTIFDTIKVKYGSTTAPSYELDGVNGATSYYTGDTEKTFGSTLVVYVYGNTKDASMDAKSFYMTLDRIDINETANDTALSTSDISMPTKWSTMNGKDGSLTLTQVTLGPKGYSDGSSDIDALSFKLKAGSSYGVKVKNLTFLGTGGTVDTNTVRSATLYRGTTAIPATVKNGSISVTQDISLAASETATFMLKIDLATNATNTGFGYYLLSGGVDAEDTSADRNIVYTNNVTVLGRDITIQSKWNVTFDQDSSINVNKYAKSILAGTTSTVAEYNLYSTYEAVNVKTATINFDKAVQDAASDVELRYNGKLIASNPTWTDNKTASFTEIDEFDTLTTETPFLVKVITNAIDENGGVTVKAAKISSIVLEDAVGKDSGSDITIGAGAASPVFDIVPVTLVTSLANTTATSVELTATAARGANTTSTNVTAKAYVTGISLTIDGNNGGLNIVTVRDDTNAAIGTWTDLSGTTNGSHTISFTGIVATTTLKVSVTHTAGIDNPSYTLSVNGVSYYTNVDGTGTVLTDRATTAKTLISK